MILADCVCEQQICSTDYRPTNLYRDSNLRSPPAIYQTATRHLPQAMVPGQHLVKVHLCDSNAYNAAIKSATIPNDNS